MTDRSSNPRNSGWLVRLYLWNRWAGAMAAGAIGGLLGGFIARALR